MSNMIVKWNSAHRLKGIIAVRNVFGLLLKEAINVLDHEGGFVCTPVQWLALRGEYMLQVDNGEDGDCPDRYIEDWTVAIYTPVEPTWLCDASPRDECLLPSN